VLVCDVFNKPPRYLEDYETEFAEEIFSRNEKIHANLADYNDILEEMFCNAPSKRAGSTEIVRKVTFAKFDEKKFISMFPDAEKKTAPKKEENTMWKTYYTSCLVNVPDIRQLEKYFGKDFYCEPSHRNVVVLLGPVKMKLIKRTRTSCKSKLRFRRSQKEDDS